MKFFYYFLFDDISNFEHITRVEVIIFKISSLFNMPIFKFFIFIIIYILDILQSI